MSKDVKFLHFFFYFISIIHPPDSQESDEGAAHRASNYSNLLPGMPRYSVLYFKILRTGSLLYRTFNSRFSRTKIWRYVDYVRLKTGSLNSKNRFARTSANSLNPVSEDIDVRSKFFSISLVFIEI